MSRRLSTFTVGGLLLGVGVERVQEVLYDLEVTPVPLADPSVAGLVNLRGQILTAIDARTRLGLPPRTSGDGGVSFIVRTGNETVGLVVDSAGDVIDVEAGAFENVPETVSATIQALVTGAYKLDQGLLLVLDADLALSVTTS